jgi:hypothetical protein
MPKRFCRAAKRTRHLSNSSAPSPCIPRPGMQRLPCRR